MTCLLQQPKWTKIPAVIIWNPSRRIAPQVALAFIESHFLSKIAPKLKKKKKKTRQEKLIVFSILILKKKVGRGVFASMLGWIKWKISLAFLPSLRFLCRMIHCVLLEIEALVLRLALPPVGWLVVSGFMFRTSFFNLLMRSFVPSLPHSTNRNWILTICQARTLC